jgi:penicillin amidase
MTMRLPILLALGLLCESAQPATADVWDREAASRAAILSGTVHIPELHQAVRVQRDRWGVAHIYARDAHDLFFAQGYVVAQDRLFQMELWKRAGQGRLAEVLGPSAIQRDINARRLRYRGDWAEEYRSYAPDALAILEDFTAGINAYIKAITRGAPPGLPVEFSIAGFKPEPWKPEDCVNRLAAYSMMGNARAELQHAQALSLLGRERATELFRFDPPASLDPAPGLDLSGLTPQLLADVVSSDARIPFPASSLRESNNWTVAGALTATGRPILANDPHRVIALPSLRYIVHLSAPGWNVIGAGEPGLPGVAAGHNEDIAWGFTIFGLDQEDLYVETLNPAAPHQYRGSDGWRPMREERETIHVRGASDVTALLHFTEHGPVLWEDGNRALALRWVGAEPGTAGYLGSLALDRAHDWQEFEQAMPRWKVPSENIVYADRKGDIGEHSTGLAPLRRTFNGLLPLPANGKYEWAGFIPNAELPHSHNPATGFIASANHKMIPAGYPHAVGFEWADPTRFDRITEVLGSARASGHKLTLADMQALQSDVISLPARRLQRLLQEATTRQSGGADRALSEAATRLLAWDCALRADSPAAALYELWTTELRHEVTRRVVPERARAAIGTLPLAWVVSQLESPSTAALAEGGAASRDALLLMTLRAAHDRLITLEGADPHRWSWGALHKAYFRHPLDGVAGGRKLLDLGPVERSGDSEVVQATGFAGDSFDQTSGASYREIFDLGDWDNSLAINVPGQSGQPHAKHYADLLPLWSTGKYFPLKFSRAAVDKLTTDLLILEP